MAKANRLERYAYFRVILIPELLEDTVEKMEVLQPWNMKTE